jgi:hypothetical protein
MPQLENFIILLQFKTLFLFFFFLYFLLLYFVLPKIHVTLFTRIKNIKKKKIYLLIIKLNKLKI